MILGIDVGYSHTKVVGEGQEFSFKSTISEGVQDVSNAIKVEYNGAEYTIAENNGIYANDLDKINSLNFQLCMFTAIAKAMKNKDVENIELVTGLPAQYYATQKTELKNLLEGKKVTMVYNGKPKCFSIEKCIVFPQSAGLFLLSPEKFKGDVCVVDIGGFTVDAAYFNNKNLQKMKTYELGMNVLYDNLVQKIKAEHKVSYDVLKAEEIINTKTIIKDGETIIIDNLVDEVLKKHTEYVINRLVGGMQEYNTSKRVFTGGGSLMLKKYLPIKEEGDTDFIFDNARAFYCIGVEKFAN